MALTESQAMVPRDSDSGSSPTLTTGAIVGIACGAGALFLGAAGLFIIYWRRQRQYDREDYGDSFDESGPQGVMGAPVTYTMDYKMDEAEHREGDHGSAYTYSPEKSTYPFSPMSGSDGASAMPTHPAYIPRALVRGSTIPSNRSTSSRSPPPFPTPPFPSASSASKTQPDDTMIQAYLSAAAAEPGEASNPQTHDLSAGGSGGSGLPSHPSPPSTLPRYPQQFPSHQQHTSPPHSAASTTTDQGNHSSYNSSGGSSSTHPLRKPRGYLPPRLNLGSGSVPGPSPSSGSGSGSGGKPLSGREGTTISGPLAFPQHFQHYAPGPGHGQQQPGPPGVPTASGWAREEFPGDGAAATTGGEEQTSPGRRLFFGGGGKGKDKKKEKKNKHGRQRSGGNRHYAEIEIGTGSDIW
jgi:hypothetical protein